MHGGIRTLDILFFLAEGRRSAAELHAWNGVFPRLFIKNLS